MAHDIFLVEFHSGYTLYIFQNPYRLYQPRSLRRRQIDLRHIAGNDHFRIHTQSGKKHFYLVCGRVLRLIENDHRIAQCTPPHKCQRSDLYHVCLHVLFQLHSRNHILQSIIQWLQIRIYFILHIPRQKAQFFSCLHSRTAQDNLLHLFVFQRFHRKGYRHISLARPRRTERKSQVVFGESLHQFLLVWRTPRNRFTVHSVNNEVLLRFYRLRFIALDNIDDYLLAQLVIFGAMFFKQLDFLLENLGLLLIADHLHHIPTGGDTHFREQILNQLYIRVIHAVKRYRIDSIQYDYSFYHSIVLCCVKDSANRE